MEIVECPVCLKKCEMGSISKPFEGSKYDCPRCLRFAFDSLAEIYVPRFFRDREDARKALQTYIKNNQIEGKFLPLKWSEIGNILRQAGVNVEGLFPPNKDKKN